MPTDDRPAIQHAGARRLLTAGLAVLLLAVGAITGMSLSPAARATMALEAIGSGQSSGVTADDASGAAVWLRSAAFAKTTRSQVFGLGGSGSGDDLPALALPPSAGFNGRCPGAAQECAATGPHRAASGQLTRRAPTGPPSSLSLAI